MTREEIMAMEPGRELDALVAEKVMGWIAWEEQRGGYTHVVFQRPGEIEPYRRSKNWEAEMKRYQTIDFSEIDHMKHIVTGIKNYSTDISAAWEVVEKMKTKLQIFTYFENEEGFEDGWLVKIEGKHVDGCETAPEAICKAALLSVLEDDPT